MRQDIIYTSDATPRKYVKASRQAAAFHALPEDLQQRAAPALIELNALEVTALLAPGNKTL